MQFSLKDGHKLMTAVLEKVRLAESLRAQIHWFAAENATTSNQAALVATLQLLTLLLDTGSTKGDMTCGIT